MVKLIEAFGGLSPFLMTMNYIPLLLAAIVWSFREVQLSNWSKSADALGVFGLLVVFLSYFVFSDDREGRETGNAAQWFLILSFLSAGLLPVASIALHWFYRKADRQTYSTFPGLNRTSELRAPRETLGDLRLRASLEPPQV